MKRSEIQMRDPFVYSENGAYYLYGTTDANCWKGEAGGFFAYRSADLNEWEPIGKVFSAGNGFWGTENFWAPEMHAYRGAYYLIASFKTPGRNRATAILRADSPEGPFVPWGEEQVTPREWMCLDGTLYVENETPYLVFCHEWVQAGDGEICVLPLKADLSGPNGAPKRLFTASQAAWTVKITHSSGMVGYVTDGPYLRMGANGKLTMLWSSITCTGYGIGAATSDDGLFGTWTQSDQPFFAGDGGHGMVFSARDGLYLAIHAPNKTPYERPVFLPVRDAEEGLVRDESRAILA